MGLSSLLNLCFLHRNVMKIHKIRSASRKKRSLVEHVLTTVILLAVLEARPSLVLAYRSTYATGTIINQAHIII
jgi:hypothetical protein